MKVEVNCTPDDDVEIVFGGRYGIEIMPRQAAHLWKELDEWDNGKVNDADEQRIGWAYVLPFFNGSVHRVTLHLGEVWYEVTTATARNLLKKLSQRSGFSESMNSYFDDIAANSGNKNNGPEFDVIGD